MKSKDKSLFLPVGSKNMVNAADGNGEWEKWRRFSRNNKHVTLVPVTPRLKDR